MLQSSYIVTIGPHSLHLLPAHSTISSLLYNDAFKFKCLERFAAGTQFLLVSDLLSMFGGNKVTKDSVSKTKCKSAVQAWELAERKNSEN